MAGYSEAIRPPKSEKISEKSHGVFLARKVKEIQAVSNFAENGRRRASPER